MFAQKQNKLLTKNIRLGLDTHKHRRSLNVLVIGGSGAAKTRSYVKPNILEANTYIRDEKDALRLVNNLIQATTPKGSHESDPFWTKAETDVVQIKLTPSRHRKGVEKREKEGVKKGTGTEEIRERV